MGSDVVMNMEHVSKKFCSQLRRSIGYGVSDISRNLLGMGTKSDSLRKDEFWAVDDVSFEICRGETLGLMGVNGSGKSTILKMVNGIYMPDKGRIEIKGKVGALIEIGAGFHPMLSGRENIYVNGAILGMSKKEIDKRFDAIVDFADIGDFIDSPVKNYSSGMHVRLGFAVAVHCEPDILLVDEVLAVGDRNFQIKCFRKMHELKKSENLSIVLVSHNEYAMREYAQRCVILERGKMIFSGPSEDAISFYINKLNMQREEVKEDGRQTENITFNHIIRKVTFLDESGIPTNTIKTGEKLAIDFTYDVERPINNPIFGISLYNSGGLCTGFWNSYANQKLPKIDSRGKVRVTIDQCDLPVDVYMCSIVVCEEEESNVLEWKDIDQKLMVERPNNTIGVLQLHQKWENIAE